MPKAAEAKKVKFSVHPRHSWVLVKKITPVEKVTDGGLIVDTSQSRSFLATVREFGSKVEGLVVGDTVIVSAFGMEMEDLEELTGEKGLLMLRDEEVYSTVEKAEE